MSDANDDPTSFVPHLDARQRAMLAEMGVRVWAPRAEAAVVEPAPAEVPAVSAPVASPPAETRPSAPPAPATAPRPAPAAPTVAPVAQSTPPATAERLRPAGVAQMDWPALQAAVDEVLPAAAIAGACNAVRLGPQGQLQGDINLLLIFITVYIQQIFCSYALCHGIIR